MAAVTGAVTVEVLLTVVASEVVPHFTVAPEIKFVPVTVNVNAAPPAVAELGLKLVMVGAAGLMVNTFAAEVPPLVVTVTFTVPAVAIIAAVTGAVTVVALLTVVASEVVPHFTVAPEIKFVPVTVSVNAAPPAVAELGLKLVIVGAAGLMVNTLAAEVPPLVVTVTFTVPAVAIMAAVTGAVTVVVLLTVVASEVVPHFTVAPEIKFVPVTVSVNPAPPAVAELGLKLVMVGAAGLMVKAFAADVPPEVVTVTFTVPAVAIMAAVTGAVTVDVLLTVVASEVVPHFTVAPEIKFVPVTVSVNAAPPAVAVVGLKLVIVGAAGLIVNTFAAEVPPLVVTVTFTVPAVAIIAAVTGAVTVVVLLTVVASEVVPHFTVAPEIKFVPVTVNLNAAPPAVAELGLKLVIVGAGGLMVNTLAAEVPPEVVTVTFTVPAVAIMAAVTGAVTVVVLLTVVASEVVPHFTVAPEIKFVPVTVNLNAAPPAVAELGLKLVIVGAGGLMVKAFAADVPPEVVTVTFTVPAVAIIAAVTGAVTVEVLLTVVASEAVPHFTVAPEIKFVPVTVNLNAAPPATAVVGLKLVIVGAAAKAAVPDTKARPTGITTANRRVRARMLSISYFLRGQRTLPLDKTTSTACVRNSGGVQATGGWLRSCSHLK